MVGQIGVGFINFVTVFFFFFSIRLGCSDCGGL
jgi:hypothetical protein